MPFYIYIHWQLYSITKSLITPASLPPTGIHFPSLLCNPSPSLATRQPSQLQIETGLLFDHHYHPLLSPLPLLFLLGPSPTEPIKKMLFRTTPQFFLPRWFWFPFVQTRVPISIHRLEKVILSLTWLLLRYTLPPAIISFRSFVEQNLNVYSGFEGLNF